MMMIIAWAIIARTQQDEKKKRCFLCLKDEVSTIPGMHLKASQLLHCDRNPDEDEANEELEGLKDEVLSIPDMHLKATQLLHCDRNPDEDEANEELEGEVDHALHRHRDRRRVLRTLGVLNAKDRIDHTANANVDAEHDDPTASRQDCPQA